MPSLVLGSEQLVGQLIPATIIGNFFAIVCTGLLTRLGEQKPRLSGKGQLVKMSDGDDLKDALIEDQSPIDVKLMGRRAYRLYALYSRRSVGTRHWVSWTCSHDRGSRFLEILECRTKETQKGSRNSFTNSSWVTLHFHSWQD